MPVRDSALMRSSDHSVRAGGDRRDGRRDQSVLVAGWKIDCLLHRGRAAVSRSRRRDRADDLQPGEAKLLFTTSGDIGDFDVTADGSSFLIIRIDANEQAQPMTVVVNWQSGL